MRNRRLSRIVLGTSLSVFLLSTLPGQSRTEDEALCANPSLTASAPITLNRPRALVVDDFNNDGKPDVAVGSSSAVSFISVLLGNGSGGFSAPINTMAGRNIFSLASADFNGDGNKDLLIGNEQDSGGEAAVVLGNGSGGFGPQQQLFIQPFVANIVPAVATGDMNGDTKQDLILLMTGPFAGSQVIVMHGNGANSFTVASTSSTGGFNPTAMSVTDINADTKLDVIVTNASSPSTVAVLLGDGAGNLATANTFAVGTFPTALIVDDFNGDGKKDAAVANGGSDDISILFGDGAGSLGSTTTVSDVGDFPQSLAKGDFDDDGERDLIVISSTPGTVTVLLKQGGTFVKAGNFSFGGPASSFETIALVAANFNVDSRSDVFVINQTSSRGWALMNDCDTIGAQTTLAATNFVGFETGVFPPPAGISSIIVSRVGNVTGPATVDFNTGDGTAVANSDYTPVSGTLSFASGEFFKTITVSLLDDNVTEDLESFFFNLTNATGSSTLGSPSTAQVFILDDDPAPQISINDVAITEGNTGNASADFLVSLTHPSASPITVHFETANGSATAGSDYQSSSGTLTFEPLQVAKTISVAISGDTSPEITETFVVNLSAPTNATIIDDQGLGTIRDDDSACPEPSFSSVNNFTVGTNPFDLVAADFNGDGKTDLATANIESANVSLLIGDGNGTFAPAVNFAVPDRPMAIAAGDFNSDNKPDLVVIRDQSNGAGGGFSILLNNGAGGFSPANSSTVANLRDVAVADFNADSKLDLAIVAFTTGSGAGVMSIRFGDGSGGFGAPTNHAVGNFPMEVVAVNVNAETKPDVVVANQNSGDVSVLLNNGDGTFGTATSFLAGVNPQSVAAGDIDSDGKADLIVPSNSGLITVLLGDGTGTFFQGTNLLVGQRSERIVLADLNGDGILDLAVSDLDSDFVTPDDAGVWVMFGNGAGKFTAPTTLIPVEQSPFAIVAANFDSGVRTDLAFVQLLSTSVGVLLNTCSLSLPGPLVQFNASRIEVFEAANSVSFNVVRSGNTQAQASVDFSAIDPGSVSNCSTTNGTASSRCDYLATLGTLTFAPNETSKSLTIPIADDSFAEGNETFSVTLSNPGGGALGSPSTLTITIIDNDVQTGSNPIDVPEFFVRQHYSDFLNRVPDQEGLDFWIGNFTQCGGNAQCLEVRRINVSAAFFLSIEFQQTGYLVERIYKTAYGDRSATSTLGGAHQISVPIIRLNEFLADSQKIRKDLIVGQPNWEQVLELNKQAFVAEFVTRTRFTTAFPNSLTPTQFVDQLNSNAGNPLSQAARTQLITGLTGGQLTRGQVLRAIAEDPALNSAEFNRAFVLMQYFGYLRRNPDDVPDSDFTGYDFWLTKLNQFNGDFIKAEMVKAFISSLEYRQRFGP